MGCLRSTGILETSAILLFTLNRSGLQMDLSKRILNFEGKEFENESESEIKKNWMKTEWYFLKTGWACSLPFALIWRWRALCKTGKTKHFKKRKSEKKNWGNYQLSPQALKIKKHRDGGSCSFDERSGLPDSDCRFTVTGPENLESSAMALPQVVAVGDLGVFDKSDVIRLVKQCCCCRFAASTTFAKTLKPTSTTPSSPTGSWVVISQVGKHG